MRSCHPQRSPTRRYSWWLSSGVVGAVGDRGPGIPEPERERVFHRLVRLDSSRGTPGSGLGLSLVRAVARLHEGRVWIEDNEPGGRIFVRLPAAGTGDGAGAPPPEPPRVARGRGS